MVDRRKLQNPSGGSKSVMSESTRLIGTPNEVRKALSSAIELYSKVTFQVRGLEKQFKSRLPDQGKLVDSFVIDPISESEMNELKTALETTKSNQCLVLIYIKGHNVLALNADFLGPVKDPAKKDSEPDHECRLRFTMPERGFRIQRRKEARFPIPNGYDLYIEMDNVEDSMKRVKKRLIDISRSGLAFFVLSPRESNFYKQGAQLRNLQFVIQNKKITVDAVICNRIPIAEGTQQEGGTKVGVAFTKINAKDSEFLGEFVFSQMAYLKVK